MDEDCTPSASPLVEAEMMRINSVLSNFGESSAETPVLPLQTCQRVKTCKKREFVCHPDFWDVWSDHSLFDLYLCASLVYPHTSLFPVVLCCDHIPVHLPAGVRGVRTSGLGLSLCDVTNLSPAAYRKFSCGGSRPSDARCSTPVPVRRRRSTMAVDYKEPKLNA